MTCSNGPVDEDTTTGSEDEEFEQAETELEKTGPRMPHGITEWYSMGMRLAQVICDRAGCQSSPDTCSSCDFNQALENMKWHYEMGFLALVKKRVLFMKVTFEKTIDRLQKARKLRESRNPLVV